MRKLLLSVLSAGAIATIGCTSSQDMELLHREITDVSRQVEKYSEHLTELRMKRMELEARRRQLLALRSGDPLKEASALLGENPVANDIKKTYVEERRKLEREIGECERELRRRASLRLRHLVDLLVDHGPGRPRGRRSRADDARVLDDRRPGTAGVAVDPGEDDSR